MEFTLLSDFTNTDETVKVLNKMALEASRDKRIIQEAKKLKRSTLPETLRAVFNQAYKKILYRPDPKDMQQLRTVNNIYRDGVGNCATYSFYIGSLLYALDIPFSYRVAEYKPGKGFEHIYIFSNGFTLDCVIGQSQNGTETRQNRPLNGKFNEEIAYYRKKDYNSTMTKLGVLNGYVQNSELIALNRSKMTRYRLKGTGSALGCGCGCGSCNEPQLGSLFGDILRDSTKFLGNVLVTPIETIAQKDIINQDYNTGAFSMADKLLTSAKQTVSQAVTGGAVSTWNPYNMTQQQPTNTQTIPQQQTAGGGLFPLLLIAGVGGAILLNKKKKRKR